MKHLPRKSTALVLAALVSTLPAMATDKLPDDPSQDPLMITAGFLTGHPDLRFRLLALEKREQGKQEDAFRFFKRAAFYGDKPSQAMVAEMLWTGVGTPVDKAQAYAWMDLAAERGYEGFLELRERYWARLSESEREQAIVAGQDIYARFGDAAALPRIAGTLRRERSKVTGSRTGATSGNLKIYVPGPAGPQLIDGSKFYDPRYWDPVQYQAWHDSIWMKPRVATVEVGDVSQVMDTSLDTRIPEVAPAVDAEEPQTEDAMPRLDSEPVKP